MLQPKTIRRAIGTCNGPQNLNHCWLRLPGVFQPVQLRLGIGNKAVLKSFHLHKLHFQTLFRTTQDSRFLITLPRPSLSTSPGFLAALIGSLACLIASAFVFFKIFSLRNRRSVLALSAFQSKKVKRRSMKTEDTRTEGSRRLQREGSSSMFLRSSRDSPDFAFDPLAAYFPLDHHFHTNYATLLVSTAGSQDRRPWGND